MQAPLYTVPKSSAQRGQELKQWAQETVEHYWNAYLQGSSAWSCVQGLATARQQALASLFAQAQQEAANKSDLALVALGGLGRGEVSPYSDLDIVIVTPSALPKGVSEIVDSFLYPLWDAGFDVGHAVRSKKEFLSLAQTDKTVQTASLDCRFLGGNSTVFAELNADLQELFTTQSFQRNIASSIEGWMKGSEASTVYRLEPNIKTCPGGLRTIHETWWATRVAWDVQAWADLLTESKISQHDLHILEAGREFMHSIRLTLHALSARRQDILRFDIQDEVGQLLHMSPKEASRSTGDALLEQYYKHAKQLKAAATRIQEQCVQLLQSQWKSTAHKTRDTQLEGFIHSNGRLRFSSHTDLQGSPLELLRIFRVAQRHRVRVAPETRMTIAECVPLYFCEQVAKSAAAIKLFTDILTDHQGEAGWLEALHELGLLERLIPEFSNIIGLVQRDTYHVFTVDAHLIYCAQTVLSALADNPIDVPNELADALTRISRPHVLLFGALLHDIGKGTGHGHSTRGAQIADKLARRMRWNRADRIDLVFLVQEHLSMMIISQRRDLEDVTLIERFARRVENADRLDMLYILSYADAVTTGPKAYSSWKATLLRQLYQRTRLAIQSGAGQPGLAKRAKNRIIELERRVGLDTKRFRNLASKLTDRHLVTHRFALLKRHLDALEEVEAKGVSVSAQADEAVAGWEIVLGCPDHAGLLSDLAGVLAASGVDVIEAYTSATRNHYAICTFVTGPAGGDVLGNPNKCDQVCKQLAEKALQKGGDFAPGIEQRRRSARNFAAGVPISQTRIAYDLGSTDSSTVLDVFTPDRVGVLHLITRAIFEQGVMIEQARISTEGERAVDSFYVVDAADKKPLTQSARERLKKAIIQACTDALAELDVK